MPLETWRGGGRSALALGLRYLLCPSGGRGERTYRYLLARVGPARVDLRSGQRVGDRAGRAANCGEPGAEEEEGRRTWRGQHGGRGA